MLFYTMLSVCRTNRALHCAATLLLCKRSANGWAWTESTRQRLQLLYIMRPKASHLKTSLHLADKMKGLGLTLGTEPNTASHVCDWKPLVSSPVQGAELTSFYIIFFESDNDWRNQFLRNSAVVWFCCLCKLADQRLKLGHLCIVCQSYVEPPVND